MWSRRPLSRNTPASSRKADRRSNRLRGDSGLPCSRFRTSSANDALWTARCNRILAACNSSAVRMEAPRFAAGSSQRQHRAVTRCNRVRLLNRAVYPCSSATGSCCTWWQRPHSSCTCSHCTTVGVGQGPVEDNQEGPFHQRLNAGSSDSIRPREAQSAGLSVPLT